MTPQRALGLSVGAAMATIALKWSLWLAIALASSHAGAAEPVSVWESRLLDKAEQEPFTVSARRPTTLTYTVLSRPNNAPYDALGRGIHLEPQELKIQLSVQTKTADNLVGSGDVWLAYTQVAYWQAFNSAVSSPFRETNHEPEAYLSFLTDYRFLGMTARAVDFGVVHQSNGQAATLSRGWDRVFAEFHFVRGGAALAVKTWVPVNVDTNTRDIEDYVGYYELRAYYEKDRHLFALMLRNVFDSGHRYNSELAWSFPIAGRLRGLVQWYNGYGENLIDYNHKNHRIGVGILLSDWL